MVVGYSDDWPRRAASLIAALRDQLGAGAERIEHIGSTAIPGMAAKDVLDLQVTVTDLDAAARDFDQPLGSLGFRRTPYERDHVPPASTTTASGGSSACGHVAGIQAVT